MKRLIIALFLIMGMSAHASSNVESVVLNDGTVVTGNEISKTHYIPFSKKIDFLELNQGSKIESNDISSVKFKNNYSKNYQTTDALFKGIIRSGGDGSGG